MPVWLSNKQLVITKTQNGWAVGSDKGSFPEQCVVFETWDAMVYWVNANWASQSQS